MLRLLLACAAVLLACQTVLAQNGYDYQQPSNPLRPQPSGSSPARQTSGNKSQGQAAAAGGDGGEHHHSSDDPLQWLRDSVPGEPGVDYPILSKMPETSFTCDDKVPGYYADAEAGCQPFHVCSEMLGGEMMKISFMCPNGTIFNQEGFACQWWNQVDCAASEQFYSKNEEIGKVPESAAQNNNNNNNAAAASSFSGQQQQQSSQTSQTRPQNNYQQQQQQRPQNNFQQQQQQRPQNNFQQQQQQQQQRPQNNYQQQQQQQQQRPQNNFQQQQQRPQTQQSRPQPQRRPASQFSNNAYVPPASSQAPITPPPALYGLPRN